MESLRGVAYSIALLLTFLSLVPKLAIGIDAKQTAEAQALIDRAEQRSSLAQASSGPFYFQARVDYSPSKIAGKSGIYKLWWASDNRWREAAESDDLKTFKVRNEQGLWLPADMDARAEAIFEAGEGYPFRKKLVSSDEKIIGLTQRSLDGMKVSCVEVQAPNERRELCFESHYGLLVRSIDHLHNYFASGLAVSPFARGVLSFKALDSSIVLLRTGNPGWSRSVTPPGDVFIDITTEYRNYTGVGDKMVPAEIRNIEEDKVMSVLRLTSIGTQPKIPFAASLFEVPDGYEAQPACNIYHPPSPGYDFFRSAHVRVRSPNGVKLADGAKIRVLPSGNAKDVRLINRVEQSSQGLVSNFLHQDYVPATCDGKPTSGTLFIDFTGI